MIYYTFRSSQEVLREQIDRSNKEVVTRIASNMDNLSERMMNASNLIVNDPDIQSFLLMDTDWTDNYDSFQRYQSIQTKLANLKELVMDSDAIVAVVDYRGYVHSAPNPSGGRIEYNDLAMEKWFAETAKAGGWPHWEFPYEGAMAGQGSDEDGEWFLLARLIKSQQGDEGIGLAVIGVPAATFFPGDETLGQDKQTNTLLLASGNRRLLDSAGPALPELTDKLLESVPPDSGGSAVKVKTADRSYVARAVQVPQLGWELVNVVPQTELMQQLQRIKNQSYLWLFAWFAVFTIVFVLLMLSFTKPLRALLLLMGRVGKGDFNVQVAVKGRDEVARLGAHFNLMTANLRELIDRLSDEQKRKDEARFQALQAQINPHFLFNTLNSMKWMATLSGAKHVSQMMTKLGKLLEFTMRYDREFIPLAEEFARLEDYLDLQRIRFHDNVLIETDLPEELKGCGILKFTLQPIVENAIIHGNRTPLGIRISAAEADGQLELIVADNGVGMDAMQLEELVQSMNHSHSRFNGIGIRNVHERIRMHYGDRFGVLLRSVPGEGTTVTIRMPILPQKIASHDDNAKQLEG
nr:sensor histidine kinase [Cohnella lubricantis]